MAEQMLTQEEDIKKQIQIYREETAKKKVEEAQLTKVEKEYAQKFKEFETSVRMSKKNLTQYEKEVNSMNRKISQLESQKKEAFKIVTNP